MKKLFLVLVATITCGACLFTSCKKNETPTSSEPEGEAFVVPEEPTTDQLEVKVTVPMPTAALSSFDENSMARALLKRVSSTTNAIGSDTKMVLFKGSDILSISNDVWRQMARVYMNDGYIGIERATNSEVLAFAMGLGLAVGIVQDELLEESGIEVSGKNASNASSAYANELQRRVANAGVLTKAVADVEENPDSIDFELFILTPAKSFSQAPYNAEETISSTSVDESGKETTREVQVQHLQNAYHYGLLADGAAAFVNQREKEKEEPESKAFALTKSGGEKAMNDVLGCSDEFVIHHSLSAIDPAGKDVTRQNMVTTTLKSWSVHDFGSNQDFYYVDEKVEARMGGQNSDYNKTLYWGPYTEKWKPSKPFVYDGQQYNYYYGSWLNRIKHSLDLTGAGTVTVEASVPSTDNSSESKTIAVGTSDSQSSTEGWNIGFSGGGDSSGKLSGSFSFGYSSSTTTSHSNSFTMTHGSTNKALKLARNTRGTEVTFDYSEGVKPDWSWKPFQIVHMAPDILTNDCEVNNMVCWRVKNPSDSYKLKISTRHETSSMCVFYVFEGFPNNTGSWSGYNMTWSDTYTLKQPCRYLGSWNCDIAITGKNYVANASELFRKYLQGVIVEAAFKHQFNVAEMEQGELDVMKNLMRNISLAMSQPEAKRKMIENYAKELGIESYIITWFSNDPTVEEKFTLSRAIE